MHNESSDKCMLGTCIKCGDDIYHSKKIRVCHCCRLSSNKKKTTKDIKKPSTRRNRNYTCSDCDKWFRSSEKILDIICPKCKSIHIYVSTRFNIKDNTR